jgi:Flp pilus assembly pilin Flp
VNQSHLPHLPRINLSSIACFLRTSEAGQTATEYVAMTAVALLAAILLTWTTLSGALGNAINEMSSKLMDFMANPPGL